MTVSLIVAMTDGGVIGRDGQLPWRLSADLRRFKRLTIGHHIIMGRKTFESIGRLLPGRTTVVITRQTDLAVPGAKIVHSLNEALQVTGDAAEVFIVGGGEIYRQALPMVDRIYQTIVHALVEGDTVFPALDPSQWSIIEDERHASDERNQYEYSFQVLERRADGCDDREGEAPAEPDE
jgi:dihydrofolate reductase